MQEQPCLGSLAVGSSSLWEHLPLRKQMEGLDPPDVGTELFCQKPACLGPRVLGAVLALSSSSLGNSPSLLMEKAPSAIAPSDCLETASVCSRPGEVLD